MSVSPVGAQYRRREAQEDECTSIANACVEMYEKEIKSEPSPSGILPTGTVTRIGSGTQAKIYSWTPNQGSSIPQCAIRVRNIWRSYIYFTPGKKERNPLPPSDREIKIEDSLKFSELVPKIYHRVVICPPDLEAVFSVTFMELLPQFHLPPSTITFSFYEFQDFAKQSFQFLLDLKKAKVLHLDLNSSNCICRPPHQAAKYYDFGCSYYLNSELELPDGIVPSLFRPPELWLGLKALYGHPIDMWSMGCLFFLSFTGKYLFKGLSKANLFTQFSNYLGTPPQYMIESCKSEGINTAELSDKPLLSEAILNCQMMLDTDMSLEASQNKGRELVDLIQRMLAYDPSKRITPEEALKHPFFRMTSLEYFPQNIRQLIEEYRGGADPIPPPASASSSSSSSSRRKHRIPLEATVAPNKQAKGSKASASSSSDE